MTTRDELFDKIRGLPQAAVIDPKNAARWIDRVLVIDPERAAWHVERAGGFGGSEIGGLVASRAGDYHPFSSAAEVIRRKLLVIPPDEHTDDTRRGTELESFVISLFERHLREAGVAFRTRPDLKALIQSAPHPKYPWLRASLDEVYEIDGGVYIVDAKAPTEEVLEGYKKYEDFDDYRYQLHHYRLAAEGKGVHVDGLILAMYEYRRNAVIPFHVPHDPALDAQIVDAGDHYWSAHVLAGVTPEYEGRVTAVADDGVPADVEGAAREWIGWKMASDHAALKASEARGYVERWVSKTGELGDAVLPLAGLMQVRAKPEYDREAMADRLRQLGWDAERIERMRGASKFDPKKLPGAYEALLRASRAVVGAVTENGDIAGAVQALAAALETAPIKEKGEFEIAILCEALVSCKEIPQRFLHEKLSSALPRSKAFAVELAERREEVEQRLGTLVEEIAAPAPVAANEEEPDLEHPISLTAP